MKWDKLDEHGTLIKISLTVKLPSFAMNSLPPLLFAGAALLAFSASSVAATVFDDFSGTYPGGGTGWKEEWNYRHRRTVSPNSKAESRNTNPLSGSDYYLSVRYEHELLGDQSYSIISRPFDANVVDNQAAHRVSFDFRLDFATHWNNAQEEIVIFASSVALARDKAYNATTTNTWGVKYNGASGWTVVESDGAGGIRDISPSALFKSAADASTVYSISIEINPVARTFMVSISDGDRTETWENAAFDFINPAATAGGEHLHFYANTRQGVNVEYAVANLQVQAIPEPGTTALLGLAVAGLGLSGMKGLLRRRESAK